MSHIVAQTPEDVIEFITTREHHEGSWLNSAGHDIEHPSEAETMLLKGPLHSIAIPVEIWLKTDNVIPHPDFVGSKKMFAIEK